MTMLPHQIHKKSVKKTAAHITKVKAAQKRERSKHKTEGRSSRWPTVRKKFLSKIKAAGNGCAARGAKIGLQVHHKKPFHIHPELELDPTNLIALCMYV